MLTLRLPPCVARPATSGTTSGSARSPAHFESIARIDAVTGVGTSILSFPQWRSSAIMTGKIARSVILILFLVLPSLDAATLKPETKEAWDAYLQAANEAMQARLQPGAHFLWLDEEPDRREEVRSKGPYIAPISRDIPRKVPHGLIHDWLGAGFLPDTKIEDILMVVRDYDHYKNMYRPGVIDSMSRGTDGMKDLFFMRLVNRSVVAKTALDAECEVSYIRVDDQHW